MSANVHDLAKALIRQMEDAHLERQRWKPLEWKYCDLVSLVDRVACESLVINRKRH